MSKETRSERIIFRAKPDLDLGLRLEAEKRYMTKSNLIHMILEEWLKGIQKEVGSNA